MRNLLLLMFLAGVSTGCRGGQTPEATDRGPADLILSHGRVYTVNAAQPWAEAIGIRGGEIVYVGDDDGALALRGANTQVVHLHGRLVLPGFQDLHTHVLEAGLNEDLCALSPGADAEDYVTEIRQCAAEQKDAPWVRAAGMSLDILDHEAESPLMLLDRAVPDRPLIVLDDLGHAAFANRLGLRAAGIDEDTQDPPGGLIGRDSDSDAPTGVLYEGAQYRLRDAAASDAERVYAGLLAGLAQLPRHGITTVSDAGGYWTQGHDRAWQRAQAEGRLNVRAFNALFLYPDRDFDEQIEALTARYQADTDRLLHFDTVKVYMDGILDLGTAALLQPYDEPPLPEFPQGFHYFKHDLLEDYAAELTAAGFRLHFHAVGDAAVREALDVVESLEPQEDGEGQRHHRITHNYLVDPRDLSRFRQLGVVADLQFGEESASAEYARSLQPMLGERAARLLPIADLIEADAPVVISSDWDADALSPLGIIQRAVSRHDQAVPDVATAVRSLTLAPAQALGHDARTGSLEVGKKADLVVLDQDIFQVPTRRIGQTHALLTLLEGRETWRAPDFK